MVVIIFEDTFHLEAALKMFLHLKNLAYIFFENQNKNASETSKHCRTAS